MAKVNFALGLKPQKAIEWLQAKGVTAENYRNLTASEMAKVYSIARMTDLDMLNDMKQSMVKAADEGVPFGQFKKDLLQHMQNKGWLHQDSKGKPEIIDPGTGEVFGSPRRLETIYRTNMQSAFSAGQYQTYMQNVDNRPFLQYVAVNDQNTRPAHSAMHGLVYRYDDPFWATFYPPNGYNCRCTVIALAMRDMERRGLVLSESGEHNLVEVRQIINKKGESHPTMAYKTPSGQTITTDKGFNYNAGRMNYRPDLDGYDRGLAQAFAKADMTGPEFKASYEQLQQEFIELKQRLGVKGSANGEQKLAIRNTLSRNLRFAGGILSDADQAAMGMQKATVWLSDDTLIKQIDSRAGQEFGLNQYAALPDVVNQPDAIYQSGKDFTLVKKSEGHILLTVIKYLANKQEVYVQSYRISNEKELVKLSLKMKQVK